MLEFPYIPAVVSSYSLGTLVWIVDERGVHTSLDTHA
jgi:hypothetical protein